MPQRIVLILTRSPCPTLRLHQPILHIVSQRIESVVSQVAVPVIAERGARTRVSVIRIRRGIAVRFAMAINGSYKLDRVV